ncbi:MAG TPA: extracellular solute-binding protein [Acidimicrobiia bacterium]
MRWLVALAAMVIIVAACGDSGGTDTTAAPSDDGGTSAPTTEGTEPTTPPATEPPSGDKVQIRWFIGIGAGGQPEQRAAQEAVAEAFNASHDDIELVLEIVENDVAYDTLSTEIAAGNPPDIMGPVGRDGANSFSGQYLDIEPLIESTGFDISRWDPATVENFREPDGTLLGLPFASYPSFMYFNKALFDEAGLPYPPQEYGADGTAVYGEGTEYEGTWDFDKVAELATILAVDANGNDATNAAFDREQTVQWGFIWQWTDRLFQEGSFWGAGYVPQDDGTAVIPQEWADEWKWYQSAIFETGFAPTQTQMDSELLAGNAFSSGNVAMAVSHLWYTCCVRNDDGTGKDFFDIAVMPSHNGVVTANMHADTFRIMSSTTHPAEAFQVLTYLLTDAALELLNAYGAAPADPGLTDAFFAGLDEVFPQGVNWDVALASASYTDVPSHEQYMAGWDEYKLRLDDLQSGLLSDPALDLDAEIAQLEAELTAIFAANS